MRRPMRVFFVTFVTAMVIAGVGRPAFAQDQTEARSEDSAAAPEQLVVDDAMQLVSVDWVQELMEGGMTMVFLGLLSVGLLAFAVERLITMRIGRFIPAGLADRIRPLFLKRDYDAVMRELEKHPSMLGRVIAYMVTHRDADPQLVAQTAGDVGARDVADLEQRTVPFAVIAALAPLLGLLGTMIGMIEAFKLVEVFGDEGGASMLAGSISKALITTAVGLILAIPAIALYHYFKHRVHQIAQQLEATTESLYSDWFVRQTTANPRDPDSKDRTPSPEKAEPANAPAPGSRTAPAKVGKE